MRLLFIDWPRFPPKLAIGTKLCLKTIFFGRAKRPEPQKPGAIIDLDRNISRSELPALDVEKFLKVDCVRLARGKAFGEPWREDKISCQLGASFGKVFRLSPCEFAYSQLWLDLRKRNDARVRYLEGDRIWA